MRKRHRQDEEAEINLTPMLDVTFIMLIFFIVTTSFVKEAGLDVSRPQKSEQPPPEPDKVKNILIAITQANQIFMDKREIDVRAVRANVERKAAESTKTNVIILAERGSHTGTLVEVMDQIKQAGVENVSVASQRKS